MCLAPPGDKERPQLRQNSSGIRPLGEILSKSSMRGMAPKLPGARGMSAPTLHVHNQMSESYAPSDKEEGPCCRAAARRTRGGWQERGVG